jgi:nucleoside-diphosphate-sugar epimerase
MKNKKRIFITGGLGFIGHHLAPYLAERGHEVVVLDSFYHHITDERYGAFIEERVALMRDHDIHLEACDTRHTETVVALLKLHKPDMIVHLAATANAGLCNLDPCEGIDMGLMSFCSLLNAVRQSASKPHVVYSSSSMVYGNFINPTVVESDAAKPINIYGASKISCETFLECYGRVYKIPWTIIRPSALYGPRCVNRRVTQILIENVLDGKKIELANGGEPFLDFTDVRDLSQGISLIMENSEKAEREIFNITFGHARQIKDLIPLLKDELGDFAYNSVPMDSSVPKRGTLSIQRIKDRLGYAPQYPIEKGYRDLIRWYKTIKWGKPSGDKAGKKK